MLRYIVILYSCYFTDFTYGLLMHLKLHWFIPPFGCSTEKRIETAPDVTKILNSVLSFQFHLSARFRQVSVPKKTSVLGPTFRTTDCFGSVILDRHTNGEMCLCVAAKAIELRLLMTLSDDSSRIELVHRTMYHNTKWLCTKDQKTRKQYTLNARTVIRI